MVYILKYFLLNFSHSESLDPWGIILKLLNLSCSHYLHFNRSWKHKNMFTYCNLISQIIILLKLIIFFTFQGCSKILFYFSLLNCLPLEVRPLGPENFGLLVCSYLNVEFALCSFLVSRAKWNLNESTESSKWTGWCSSFLSSWYL